MCIYFISWREEVCGVDDVLCECVCVVEGCELMKGVLGVQTCMHKESTRDEYIMEGSV